MCLHVAIPKISTMSLRKRVCFSIANNVSIIHIIGLPTKSPPSCTNHSLSQCCLCAYQTTRPWHGVICWAACDHRWSYRCAVLQLGIASCHSFILQWVLFFYNTNMVCKTLLDIASINLGSVFPCEHYHFAFRQLLFLYMDAHLYGLQEVNHFFSAVWVVWPVLSSLYSLYCEGCLCDDSNFATVCLAGRFESWLTVKSGPSPSKLVASCKRPGLAANVKHSKKSRK